METKSKQRQQTIVELNDTLRTCDRIVTAIESAPNWDAYNAAIKRGSTKPWLYL